MLSRQIGRLLTIAAAVALVPFMAQAQSVITGRVVERSSQRPIPEVSVRVSGTTVGARTNELGIYRIANVPAGDVLLRATRIGFAASTRTITATNGLVEGIDFALEPAATILDEVVTNAVTGQAESRRSQGTNVGNIAVTEIDPGPLTKFSDVLQGRTAGVTLQGTSGTTGTGQRIRIRGANSLSLSNEPLVYVDGVLVSNGNAIDVGVGGQAVSRLNDIPPEDIENIEVLKGPAATAVYGTAAANGVLLITTRRGRSGTPRWNTYAETGEQKDVIDYPANYLSYRALMPGAPLFTPAGSFNFAARAACFNYQRGAGTCTPDSVAVLNTLKDRRTTPFVTGKLFKAGVNVAGGSDQTQYFLGVDNQSEHGVIEYNTLNKLGLRANLNTTLNKRLDFSLSSAYTRSNLGLNSNDNSIFSPLINGLVGLPFFVPRAADATAPDARNYRGFNQQQLSEYVGYQNINRFTLGTIGNYRPFEWLTANVNLGLDYINRFDYRTLQPNRLPIAQSFTIGTRASTQGNQFLYSATGSLSGRYSLTPSLRTTTTVGSNYSRNLLQTTVGSGAGIIEGTRNLGATTSLFSVDEGFFEVISVGNLAREELAWRDKVFLAGSVRIDANSAFGTDFGNIVYPGVNASWVVGEEPWFPKSDVLSSLRVRSSYGRSGLRPDFRQAQTFLTATAVQSGGSELAGVTLSNTGNVKLRPESVDEYEVGGDLGLIRERLSLQMTYFNRTSKDALISRRLAPSLGRTATQILNLGSIRNSGTEAQLDAKVLAMKNYELNVRGTATQLRNRVEKLGFVNGKAIAPIVFNRGTQRHQRGYSAGAFFQRPLYYTDINKDGFISRNEITRGDTAVYIGDALPRYNRSVSADLRLFRMFRVSTLFEGRGGNKQLNDGERFRCIQGLSFGNRGCSATGNPTASLREQAAFVGSAFFGSNALYVEDGSFVKWRELALTLEVPERYTGYLRTIGASAASLTVAGRNLHTWTNYTGLDPEIVEAGTSLFNQSEFNTQPTPRFYTVRVNVNF